MVFDQQDIINQKLTTITHSIERFVAQLQRAYTLIGEGRLLMKQFLDAVPSGVLFFDAAHSLFYANQAAEALLGEFIHHPTMGAIAALQACPFYLAETEIAYPIQQHPSTKLLQGEAAHITNIVLRQSERDLPLEIWIDPAVEIYRQRYSMMVFLDLSERQQLEQLLRRQMRIQAEFNSANQILSALLPNQTPQIAGFELAARCIPAAAVGGDFYDWSLNEQQALNLTVGDVMGQQISAALLMATLRAALRAVPGCPTPAEAVSQIATLLAADFDRLQSFATLFHAQLRAGRQLVYVSAGHTCGVMLRANGGGEPLGQGSLPLGIEPALTSESSYQTHTVQFQPGDRLVIYTRGIVHSRRDLDLTPANLAQQLRDCQTAEAIVERLFQITTTPEFLYDRTVLVLSCVLSDTES